MFKSNPLVLDELWRKYIHLFCLEPEAASCFLLFVALPPPAVDIDSPGGHEHQALLSPHQMHRLPGTVERTFRFNDSSPTFLFWESKRLESVTLFNSEQRCLLEFLLAAFWFSEFFCLSTCGNTPNKHEGETIKAQQIQTTEDWWSFEPAEPFWHWAQLLCFQAL